MGHDILAFNESGKEIAYARFSMGNCNAVILYSLLDAEKYYAGVSGTGSGATFTLQQIEKALHSYKQLYGSEKLLPHDWDRKQIQSFIRNCLITAQKEGSVRIGFW